MMNEQVNLYADVHKRADTYKFCFLKISVHHKDAPIMSTAIKKNNVCHDFHLYINLFV